MFDPGGKIKDALVEEAVLPATPAPLSINSFDVGPYFDTEAPEQEYLVQGVLPMKTSLVFAAQGGAGKGILLVDLCCKVAGMPSDNALFPVKAFGGAVVKHGPVVYLSAEDSGDEIHRRVRAIGKKPVHPCYIVPMPSAGGARAIIRPGPHGATVTDDWASIKKQILEIKPVLVVFDPLASFCLADVNSDPAVGAFMHSRLTALAEESGACIIMAHHTRKGGEVSTADDARASARGSTSIVDGARGLYSLWPVPEKDYKGYALSLNEQPAPDVYWFGQLTKANFKADKTRFVFKRSGAGLLVDYTERIRAATGSDNGALFSILASAVEEAEAQKHPLSRSHANGLYVRRDDLPPPLLTMGKSRLEELAADAIKAGIITTRKDGKNTFLTTPGARTR